MMTRQELIHRYFDDELGSDARRHVEATMSQAERAELAALAEVRRLLRACLRRSDGDPHQDGAVALSAASTRDADPRRRSRWLRKP
jgi:hypothetical protein